ncbi:MAG: hypothetical protein HC771_18845 [Synechococcales cyanobacterium CRU_2_2]|nr:hypothetical protein [Synechococcales cyanobacterium CRU_2_2]
MQPSLTAETAPGNQSEAGVEFRVSLLIRLTLLLLYGALTLPLPVLAAVTGAFSPSVLTVGLGLGAIALYAALTERVVLTETHIQLTYATWAKLLWRRGWSLPWADIASLKPRSTGQGGIVYYFLSKSSDRAFLLPMRMARFARLVSQVEAKTGLDMRDVKPLAQPWMYWILLGCTGLLLLVDAWVLWMGLTQGFPV